jgi:hypothetical protein
MKKSALTSVNISPHQILSPEGLSFLKGGAAVQSNTNKAKNAIANTEDDKRRERPGGGIAT